MSRSIPHDNPAGRPIHPDCQRVRSEVIPCTCAQKWLFWNGTDAALDTQIKRQTRLDLRDRAGRIATQDDTLQLDEIVDLDGEPLVDGFWKESEFLKCIAGRPLTD